ncbi:MAG: hypothetical protein WDZ69_01135 [Candidatus Pacearchaeota archaeon]
MIKPKKEKSEKNQRIVAITQIFILVVAIFSFSYFLGSSLPSVSAQEGDSDFDNGAAEGETGQINRRSVNPITDIGVPIGANIASDKILERINIGDAEGTLEATTGGETSSPSGIGAVLDPTTASIGSGAGWGVLWNTLGYAAANAAYAFAVKGLTQYGFQIAGASPELSESAGKGAFWGYVVGATTAKTLGLLGVENFLTSTILWGAVPALGPIVATIGILYKVMSFKQARYDSVSFSCYPWDAPLGGENCELCNDEEIPCTEYRCKSLGQSCEIINEGTENKKCEFVDRDDIKPAVIEPWNDVLTEGYSYSDDDAINPPHKGVEIVRNEGDSGCVAPFTPLEFGVELDKNARCKIVPVSGRASTFEDMQNIFMSGGMSDESHQFRMSLPSHQSLAAENITYQHGGEISLYVRCQTPQGYSNTADFQFRFCVDDGPDTEEPVITNTLPSDNSHIAFNQSSVRSSIFVNEPAECRWSRLEQSYEDMPEENQMDCPESALESTSLGEYRCNTELTGLRNRDNNDFYISCKDQPHLEGTEEENQRNANEIPYHLRIIGTQPLVLDSAGPNATTIKDSTNVIKVELEVKTSAGANRGESLCSFSPAGENRFSNFIETGSHEHSQRLDLSAGSYSYDIRCTDSGGNSDTTQISFTVETDIQAPGVVRVFQSSGNLNIITNEEAECVYSNDLSLGCGYPFEKGDKMNPSEGDTEHSTNWQSNRNFYIKCADGFGNRPTKPDECSITVRPYDVS